MSFAIAPQNNGPYLVTGPFSLTTPGGIRQFGDGEIVALCRCGQSANKPFCDTAHVRVGFDSSASAEPAPEPTA